MEIRIALAGNPNCGKTTLFNALTGSNQYVGNWPGVTVEKKEGKLKGRKDVIITDLPGIYSLSPYTMEEVVARNYLVGERPEAILNIIDGTNLERNLYLTTQLIELGIPVVAAINMMDVVEKNGDKINTEQLAKELGCEICEISALKGTGINEAVEKAIRAAEAGKAVVPQHIFSGAVEHAIAHIEEAVLHDLPDSQQRWYAIKIFERDEKILELMKIPEKKMAHIENDIRAAEAELDDESDSIITNDRYVYITAIIKKCLVRKNKDGLSTSDRIDRIVTNRFLGLPVFALVMFLVYYVSMVTVGANASGWVNDGVFGDGWYLLGIGRAEYTQACDEYNDAYAALDAFGAAPDADAPGFDEQKTLAELGRNVPTEVCVPYEIQDEDTLQTHTVLVYAGDIPAGVDEEKVLGTSYKGAVRYFAVNGFDEPDPADYGRFVPGIPGLVTEALDSVNCVDWLKGLIVNGILTGVGSVLGFLPQLLVLFLFLAFLESCGYMSRVAFVLDRLFRKFGLSGKSFIPILIGTGCGVPGIMASRTIENVRDRRMTIMTTTFIPCGAKVPFISMIAGAVFHNSPWVSTGAYFIGIAAILTSGVILKKTKMFSGDPSPFVMELPAYHFPTVSSVLRSMWDRGWSFIKKAGTVILLSTILVWFTSYFGVVDGTFRMLDESEMNCSILAMIGGAICWLFAPLGWGQWQTAVASITGLVAKENIVGTLGVLYGGSGDVYGSIAGVFTASSAMSFLIFNLLCAPCFAAISAIRREMNSRKWFWFAIGYECGFAYAISLIVNQLGNLFSGTLLTAGSGAVCNIISLVFAAVILVWLVYLLFRPADRNRTITKNTD